MQAFLTGLEQEDSRYGMRLNETRTEILSSTPQTDPVFFSSGGPVEVVDVVKYLGSMISFNKPFEVAFLHRLGVAETAYKKMRLVWNCNMPRRKKVIHGHICPVSYVRTRCPHLNHQRP